ncbi:hypothetical protein [Rhizobium ruizarguesonis]|uniref:hypothetical protein n=1 Tax=Rhizobium ruizarguesonis TaxID=2081791 RepID=UPI0018D59655|nr:hypothetical protein [Rhizobium ruizarguesonis]
MVSMTVSTIVDSARGMEFLFSLNHINVAISRANALALLFGEPRLRETKCRTIEQMQLAKTLCALKEIGRHIQDTEAFARNHTTRLLE